jgi:hypothetical protein
VVTAYSNLIASLPYAGFSDLVKTVRRESGLAVTEAELEYLRRYFKE